MQPTNAEIQIRRARELGDLVDIILEEGAEPVSRREPFLEGYGALSAQNLKSGEAVEVLFPNGWQSGGTFDGYRAAGRDEDFRRLDVKMADGRVIEGAHPDCVRPEAIAVGDRVLCVDDSASFNRLRHGATYTATASFEGSPTVEVSGATHSIERFRKLAAAIVPPPPAPAFFINGEAMNLSDFFAVNEDLEDGLQASIEALQPGQFLVVGGGAAQVFVVSCGSPVTLVEASSRFGWDAVVGGARLGDDEAGVTGEVRSVDYDFGAVEAAASSGLSASAPARKGRKPWTNGR